MLYVECLLCVPLKFIIASLSISIASVSAYGVDLSPIPSVGRSVGLCVWKVYCGKTADWIRMPFGMVSGFGRGMGVLDGGGNRRRTRDSFGDEFGRPVVTNGDFVT